MTHHAPPAAEPAAYTPTALRALADDHDQGSACTWPARDHFGPIARAYADLLDHTTTDPATEAPA